MQDGVDFGLEEEVARNPFSVKSWWAYITAKQGASDSTRFALYERAVKALPGSYKLWLAYLQDRRKAVSAGPIPHSQATA